MVKCPQCKQEIPKKAKFCPYCREKIIKKNLKISNKVFFIAALLQLFVISILALNVYRKSDKFVLYLLNKQEYVKAADKINQNSSLQDNSSIYEYILQSIENNEINYIDENIDYLQAKNFLDNFRGINADNISEKIDDSNNLIEKIYKSRIEFQDAELEMNNENYEVAIEHYMNVVQEDNEYYNKSKNQIEIANNKIEEKIENDKNSILKLSQDYLEQQNYRASINELKNAEITYSDDSSFIEKCKIKESECLDKWIENMRQENNYFKNEGAVAVADEFKDILSDEKIIDNLISEGQIFEKEKFIQLLNSKRNVELENSINININIAQQLLENFDEESSLINDELNKKFSDWKQWISIKPFGYNSAEEIFNEYEQNISEYPEFDNLYNDVYRYIDVGMKYNKNDKICYWYVILIS